MAAGRDYTGVVLWWGLGLGAVLIATACGDARHLRCLLYAGVITACGSAGALVIRWGFQGQVPGGVSSINEAPSVAMQAEDNTQRIDALELQGDMLETKLIAAYRAIGNANRAIGLPVPDMDVTQPGPVLTIVPRGEASLCAAAVTRPLGR